MEPVLGPSQDTLDLPAVHPNRTSRQSSTLWLRGNVSWYRICVHRLPHRTCVLHDVGFLTEPALCFAYVGSLTGPTLAFCWMADKVWFVSQEPTVYFGSCDSISRLHQVHFSTWSEHGAKCTYCFLCFCTQCKDSIVLLDTLLPMMKSFLASFTCFTPPWNVTQLAGRYQLQQNFLALHKKFIYRCFCTQKGKISDIIHYWLLYIICIM